jgi:hypothetical protein
MPRCARMEALYFGLFAGSSPAGVHGPLATSILALEVEH